jgi:hypothetical protein
MLTKAGPFQYLEREPFSIVLLLDDQRVDPDEARVSPSPCLPFGLRSGYFP